MLSDSVSTLRILRTRLKTHRGRNFVTLSDVDIFVIVSGNKKLWLSHKPNWVRWSKLFHSFQISHEGHNKTKNNNNNSSKEMNDSAADRWCSSDRIVGLRHTNRCFATANCNRQLFSSPPNPHGLWKQRRNQQFVYRLERNWDSKMSL